MKKLPRPVKQEAPREESAEPEIEETHELIQARLNRDTWQRHAASDNATRYAREQAQLWARRTAEIEQSLRPISTDNIISFVDAETAIRELRAIRAQVAREGQPIGLL